MMPMSGGRGTGKFLFPVSPEGKRSLPCFILQSMAKAEASSSLPPFHCRPSLLGLGLLLFLTLVPFLVPFPQRLCLSNPLLQWAGW